MKKNKLLLALLPLTLLVSSCVNNDVTSTSQITTSGSTNTSQTTSTTTSTTNVIIQDITIYYYASIYESYAGETYYSGKGKTNELITDKPADPVSKYEEFNTFIGWSTKPLIVTEDDLWDFENDLIPPNIYPPVLTLYGIWDYVE